MYTHVWVHVSRHSHGQRTCRGQFSFSWVPEIKLRPSGWWQVPSIRIRGEGFFLFVCLFSDLEMLTNSEYLLRVLWLAPSFKWYSQLSTRLGHMHVFVLSYGALLSLPGCPQLRKQHQWVGRGHRDELLRRWLQGTSSTLLHGGGHLYSGRNQSRL